MKNKWIIGYAHKREPLTRVNFVDAEVISLKHFMALHSWVKKTMLDPQVLEITYEINRFESEEKALDFLRKMGYSKHKQLGVWRKYSQKLQLIA
jgi:hypothetical protein